MVKGGALSQSIFFPAAEGGAKIDLCGERGKGSDPSVAFTKVVAPEEALSGRFRDRSGPATLRRPSSPLTMMSHCFQVNQCQLPE